MYLADRREEQNTFGGRFFHIPRSLEGELVVVIIEKLVVVSSKRRS